MVYRAKQGITGIEPTFLQGHVVLQAPQQNIRCKLY